jgi:NADPH:quinone reductase-like Zn-dependent oxidoreductase
MDISQREGGYPPPPGASDILGVEFSGIVAELREGSGQRWKVGDEVIGLAGGVSYSCISSMDHKLNWFSELHHREHTRSSSACVRPT